MLLWHPQWISARSTSQAWETVRTILSPFDLLLNTRTGAEVIIFILSRIQCENDLVLLLSCTISPVCMEAHCCQEKEKKDEKYMIDNNDYDYELSCK